MTTDVIQISLTETNFLTRWHCHVCGGRTEKDPILAEGSQAVGERHYRTVRVCDQCLKAADGSIDQRLELHARQLEAEAALTRELIGKLVVPTYAEWEAAIRQHDEELSREHESFSATTAPFAEDDNTQSIPL